MPQWLPHGENPVQGPSDSCGIGTTRGWVKPPGHPGWWPAGCGKLWALWINGATKLRPLWLSGARLDLTSLSKGAEPRAGAMKVFTGMLACLQVSELGRVPLKSPWKNLLLWDRKQGLPDGENTSVKEL